MTKILILATSIKTRGGVTSVCKALMAGEQWQIYNCKWVETHRDIGGLLGKLLFMFKGLLKYVMIVWKYDLIHMHIGEPSSAIRKCPFMFIAKILRKKTIVHYHSFSAETSIKSKFGLIYRYLFTQADKVIVLSKYWENEVNNLFGFENKCIVVYNPSPIVHIDRSVRKEKIILYAGTVNRRKGYFDMINAFALIAKKYSDWKIVFAGNGEIEQGKKLAASLGILGQTVFLGWIDGRNKDDIFNRASIFCLPSYAEGFSMAVLDAWAYHLPVITTPVGGIPEIVTDGKDALLFKSGDIKKLANQMDKFISSPILRRKISEQGQHLAETIFDINTFNLHINKIYRSLIYGR